MNSSENKTFCPYPWIHVMTQPTGTMSWCCVARDNIKDSEGRSMIVDKHNGSMSAAWNSKHMAEVRQQMYEGKEVKGCEHCYYLESVGQESYRTGYIRDWMAGDMGKDIERRIEESKNNDWKVKDDPVYLDFRLGNLCNLKCRMCQPQNSSQIYREFQKIMKEDDTFEPLAKQYNWGYMGEVIPEWWDSPSFLHDVIKWMPNLKKMYFTGGEPTVIERNYWIMEKAIEMGVSENMEIMFNTNCTNLRKDWQEMIGKFNNVTACLSIDATEGLIEYIRTNTKWDVAKKNIDFYISHPKVRTLIFSPVIQTLNIFDLEHLILYVEDLQQKTPDKRLWISYLICDYPPLLDIRIIPHELRKPAIERIEWLLEQPFKIYEQPQNKRGLEMVLNILKTADIENAEQLRKDFFEYMAKLDKPRNQDLLTSVPALKPLGDYVNKG